ncbi:MAG: NrpR regulatory domain-containing protein [Candidatus Margulisiibacteriota bacterium]
MQRKMNSILKIVAESNEPVGSKEISEKLEQLGIDMPERTVRYHLKKLNEKGLLKVFWKEGRMITSKGMEELNEALIYDKVGLVSAKIETKAYKMDFDVDKKEGSVILNLSLFCKNDFEQAREVMAPVFEKRYATSDLVAVAGEGEQLGGVTVPEGKVAFGTLCTININGIFLRHSIPVESKFGGLLRIEKENPLRFTDLIEYKGTTLDPHEIFIKSRMTSVNRACLGTGKVLAGLREIPSAGCHEAEAILRKIESARVGRVIAIGRPGQAILGWPIGEQRVGIVVPGGLNPVAAAEEAGIKTESKALFTLLDYRELKSFWEIHNRF